jgi:hypothetical protein
MKTSALWKALAFAIPFTLSGAAFADDNACYLHREMPLERQLRRLSIDLRGTVPDMAEYEALAGKSEIPGEVIDGYLESDEFRLQMRHYHEDLLWTNPSTVLGDVGFALSAQVLPNAGTVYSVGSQAKRKLYRGGDGTHACQDKPQSDLGYDPVTKLPNTDPMPPDGSVPVVAEGWVELHPYWEPDPTKLVKVCAFDAQATESYIVPDGSADAGEHSCDHNLAVGKAKECGCGPSLDYCILSSVVEPAVLGSMREQLLRTVDDQVSGNHYSDLVQTKQMWMNGPLVHYFKYLGQRQTFSRTQNLHEPADGALPDLAYTDLDKWVLVEREAPHAGILTLPAYLLRFQTNRGRANRYRIAFEGQYFLPPSTKDSDCAVEGDDLTGRCVCRGCHVTLEPLASHFGQFVEAGTTALRNYEREYPTANQCSKGILPVSPAWCDRFYVQAPDPVDPDIRPYRLKALRYADDAHPLVQKNFDAGPGALAKADIDSGLFHQVAARHMFEYLMKREADVDATSLDFEGDTLKKLGEEFQSSNDLKQLVKTLVQLPAYRRMP